MSGQEIAVVERFGRSLAGVPMTGDPVIDATGQRDMLLARRACQYATAMLRRSGRLKGDLSRLDAQFRPPSTVLFIRADQKQRVVARFKVPAHVMAFDPQKPARQCQVQDASR